PGVLLNLSLAYAHLGETEKALKFLEDSLDSFKRSRATPDGTKEYCQRAEHATSILQSSSGQSARTRYMRAEVLFLENRFQESLLLLKGLQSEESSLPEYHNLFGMSYDGLSQF